MLEMVFAVLGTPTEEDLESLLSKEARKEALAYSKPWAPLNWTQMLGPEAPSAVIDLLERLLRFNPKKRQSLRAVVAWDAY